MNRVKIGFFSVTELHDPAGYLEWHQLDHMPEQYRLPGLVYGQRFVATPACREAGVVRDGELGRSQSVQLYLMEEPGKVLDAFYALGRELAGLGRLRIDLTAHISSPWQLLGTYASARVLISPEAVPFRPNRGILLLVEDIVDRGGLDAWVTRGHRRDIPAMLEVDGVVGAWTFASTGAYGLAPDPRRITVVWVDDDPAAVTTALRPALEARWRDAPVTPRLAAPFASLFPPPTVWDPDDAPTP